ncbi:hypothetical protein HK405_010698 [Cladochytrium tenue]|nr:hypothetical protein HK405_010698 [Cladochytrium tenue]
MPLDKDDDDNVHDAPNNNAPTDTGAHKKKRNKKKKTGEPSASEPIANINGGGLPKSYAELQADALRVASPASAQAPMSAQQVNALLSALDLTMRGKAAVDRTSKKSMDDYKFWSTQPVPRTDEVIEEDGEIEPAKPHSEIRQVPYELTNQFEWVEVDIDDSDQLKEVYELLWQNYVEDDDAMALKSPGWKRTWHTGVRVVSNRKLVAFISAIPTDLDVRSNVRRLVEINFLCVHKKLRSKRLAPILIKEITRRVHLEGIFQAVYTAGTYLPKPITTTTYQHRSLNPKKLIECKFSSLSPKLTMAGTIKLYKLPSEPLVPGTRVMETSDVPAVHKLLSAYLKQFAVAPIFSEEEIKHWLVPRAGVIFSFVVEDAETHEITDFYSFYSLPSTVINNPKHNCINAAYLFYYAPKGMGVDPKRTQAIMKDALIQARNRDFDVFNCLDLMSNKSFLQELNFGRGDGNLHYYLYNYRCRGLQPEQLGLMML